VSPSWPNALLRIAKQSSRELLVEATVKSQASYRVLLMANVRHAERVEDLDVAMRCPRSAGSSVALSRSFANHEGALIRCPLAYGGAEYDHVRVAVLPARARQDHQVGRRSRSGVRVELRVVIWRWPSSSSTRRWARSWPCRRSCSRGRPRGSG